MTDTYKGKCFCGSVEIETKGAPALMGYCHCESCRRATSAAFASFLGVAAGAFAWTGRPPATFASSAGVWRDFCPRCGSPMADRAARFPGEVHLYAATLIDPTGYAPSVHVHTAERLPWVHLAGGLAQE